MSAVPGPWFSSHHCLTNVQRDFVEWHRGRTPYVFWGLFLDTPAVLERVAIAADALADLLLPDYIREPHVTLDICGFQAEQPADGEEFSPMLIAGQVSRLAKAAQGPFSITLGALDSFSSAPFWAINDVDRSIERIRACLAENGRHRLFGEYVPHVTVGLYRSAWPRSEIAARLREFESMPPLSIEVSEVTLLGYQPAVIGGRLETLGRFDLIGCDMHWTNQSLFESMTA